MAPEPEHTERDMSELRHEGFVIASYLLQKQPTEAVIERYVSGTRILFETAGDAEEKKILRFILHHPATLQYLDAVSALFSPKNLLRNKILLMAAVIETAPDYCDEFFATPFGKFKFSLKLCSISLVTIWRVIVGAIVMTWVRIQ